MMVDQLAQTKTTDTDANTKHKPRKTFLRSTSKETSWALLCLLAARFRARQGWPGLGRPFSSDASYFSDTLTRWKSGQCPVRSRETAASAPPRLSMVIRPRRKHGSVCFSSLLLGCACRRPALLLAGPVGVTPADGITGSPLSRPLSLVYSVIPVSGSVRSTPSCCSTACYPVPATLRLRL